MARLFATLVIVGTFVPLSGQDSRTDIAKIFGYTGTWKSETEQFDAKFSKAWKESISLRNEC
jgi:hypothetical protein